MSEPSYYDADYFLRGKQSGKSLYENYRWMPKLTGKMVRTIIDHCDIGLVDTVLDFGCARGYTVRALRESGYTAFGYDVSKWAIENADETVKEYLTLGIRTEIGGPYDWIIAKDVLEHIEYVTGTVDTLMRSARRGVFVVVPLSMFGGVPYVIAEYEKDVTHVQRRPLIDWAQMFMLPGWSVTMQYRLKGVKDNYYRSGWEMGNGFITARRIEG